MNKWNPAGTRSRQVTWVHIKKAGERGGAASAYSRTRTIFSLSHTGHPHTGHLYLQNTLAIYSCNTRWPSTHWPSKFATQTGHLFLQHTLAIHTLTIQLCSTHWPSILAKHTGHLLLQHTLAFYSCKTHWPSNLTTHTGLPSLKHTRYTLAIISCNVTLAIHF